MSSEIVCPSCGSVSVTRTRGIPSWHTCKNGHTYKADDAYTKVAWHKISRLTQELEAVRADKSQADLEAGRWQGRAETAEMNLEASRQREAEARASEANAIADEIDARVAAGDIGGSLDAPMSVLAHMIRLRADISNHESKDTQGGT